ncbi:hypothetical protein F5887DRAFT_974602, partial [Amanita rubescens]
SQSRATLFPAPMSSLRRARFSPEIIAKIVEEVALSGDDRWTDPLLRKFTLVSRAVWDMAQRYLFSHIILTDNKRRRKNNSRLLKGPRGERLGHHVKCLYLFHSASWIHESKAAKLLSLIDSLCPNITVLHIGYNSGYLDWAALPRKQKDAIVNVMFTAKKVMLEGIENFPLHYFRVLRSVQTLDIAHIKLGPLPAENSWLPVPAPAGSNGHCPPPAPTTLAVHTGIVPAVSWPQEINSGDGDDTYDTLLALRTWNMISFSNITTLYLSSMMKCESANWLHRNIIAQCANTLETLRLCVCSSDYDRDLQFVFSCDIIDLSALTSLKSLYLVAAARFPVTLLLNLAKTLTLPETHLKELKLLVDDNLEGKDWTQNGMAGEAVDDPKSWRDLDALITRMLRMHRDTVIDFMSAPTNMPVFIDELAKFAIRMFPTASKRKRFRFLDLQFRTCE